MLVVLYGFNDNTTVNFCICCEKQFPRRNGGGGVQLVNYNSALKSALVSYWERLTVQLLNAGQCCKDSI